MLSQRDFNPPRVPQKTGNLAADYEALRNHASDLQRWVAGVFRQLNQPGSIAISQARIDVAAGLQFPATQVASSDPNNLDDYAESLSGAGWTPTDASGAALGFTSPIGTYIKIASLVVAWGSLIYPATANGANALIGGLPFTIGNIASNRGGGIVGSTTETTLAHASPVINTATVNLLSSTGTSLINSTLSGDTVVFCVIYSV